MSVGYVVSPFKSIITDQPQQQHQQYNNNAISDIYTLWWWWCGDCGCCCHCYIKYSGHHHLCTRIERRTIKVILFILCTLDKNKRVSFVRPSVTDGDWEEQESPNIALHRITTRYMAPHPSPKGLSRVFSIFFNFILISVLSINKSTVQGLLWFLSVWCLANVELHPRSPKKPTDLTWLDCLQLNGAMRN